MKQNLNVLRLIFCCFTIIGKPAYSKAYTIANGDWRTLSTAVNPSMLTTTAWERYNGTAWITQTTSPNAYVGAIGQVIFTVSGTIGITTKVFASNIIITSGTTVTGGYTTTATTLFDNIHNLEIESGGTFGTTNNFSMPSGGTTANLIVRSGGTLNINTSGAPKISSNCTMWNGIENFETGSTLYVQDYMESGILCNPAIMSVNADGFIFGNIDYNISPSYYNNAHYLVLATPASSTINLCQNINCFVSIGSTVLYKDITPAGINNNYKIVINGTAAFSYIGYVAESKSGTYDLEVKGNITLSNLSSYTGSGNGKLICSGSNDQTITDSYASSTIVNDMELVKTGTAKVNAMNNLRFTNLTLTSGILNANGFLIDLNTEYGLSYTAGVIWGKFRKLFNSTPNVITSSKALYPMGKTGDNTALRTLKIAITAAPVGGDGYLQVEYISGNSSINGLPLSVANSGGFGKIINTQNSDGYWDITLFNSIGNNKTLTVELSTNETTPASTNVMANLTQIDRVVPADSWKANGTHVATTNTAGIITTSRTGLTFNSGKAQYAIAANQLIVPLKVVSFLGSCYTNYNTIKYEVVNVINIEKLVLQKSNSVITNFENIKDLDYTNGEKSVNDYTNTDVAYYRLAIYNQDGSIDYSNILMLRRSTKKNNVITYFGNHIQLEIPSQVHIYNFNGQLLIMRNNALAIDCNSLPNGIYIAKTAQGDVLQFVK